MPENYSKRNKKFYVVENFKNTKRFKSLPSPHQLLLVNAICEMDFLNRKEYSLTDTEEEHARRDRKTSVMLLRMSLTSLVSFCKTTLPNEFLLSNGIISNTEVPSQSRRKPLTDSQIQKRIIGIQNHQALISSILKRVSSAIWMKGHPVFSSYSYEDKVAILHEYERHLRKSKKQKILEIAIRHNIPLPFNPSKLE